ncbi:multidrug transporter, partial [Spongiactinospora gelatinilytica]
MLIWAGAAITVAALAGTGIYLARVGLADADTLTSALGLAAALAGLATAVIGLFTARPTSQP